MIVQYCRKNRVVPLCIDGPTKMERNETEHSQYMMDGPKKYSKMINTRDQIQNQSSTSSVLLASYL